MDISRDLEENIAELKARMGIDESFDLILRRTRVGTRDAALLFIDGLTKDLIISRVMIWLEPGKISDVGTRFEKLKEALPHMEVNDVSTTEEVAEMVLAGPLALLVDGMNKALIIDVRQYPVRSMEEPDLERVTRGARDGLVETLVHNVALVRRRLRDPNLRARMMRVGERSKTDIALLYIKDIANPELVARVQRRIKAVKVDAMPMGCKNLEDFLFGPRFNPFPATRYTERADVAAAHLLEGHVLVVVDTTPAAMILPACMFHFVQHAEEYCQNPLVGTYLRWVRFGGMLIALLLTPLWLALVFNQERLPAWLKFIGPQESGAVPLAAQFLLLEFGIDLIRMALIHTPNALSTSLGIVGAILLGDLAVKVGMFAPETILYTAVVAIGYFAVPNIEFGLALRLFRYLLLILVLLGGLWGLGVGLVLVFLTMGFAGAFGLPYLWPLLPFNGPVLARILFRYPIPSVRHRGFPSSIDRTSGPRNKEDRSAG